MSDGDRWIVIPHWERYQHYKDRDPPWIKNYTRQLSDDDYLGLSFHQCGVLHRLRLLYAASDGQVRESTATERRRYGESTATVSRRLGGRVARATLEALSDAGLIAFSASKPLALCYKSASPEAETETEKEKASLAKGHSGDAGEPSTDLLGTDREYAIVRLLSEVKGSDEAKSRLRKWIDKAEISPGLLAPAAAMELAREELLRMRGETQIRNECAYVRQIVERYVRGEA